MRIVMKLNVIWAVYGIWAVFASQAQAIDKVTLGTNWSAEAEHGGYYQALTDGTYRKYGLDVTIVPGGPNGQNGALLVAGKIEFYLGSSMDELSAVEQGVPLIDVAAMFQKDPQILMAHPGQGIEKFEDLSKAKTIFLGRGGYATFFEWMKANFKGFRDEQYKPYNFNPAPFIADPKSVQQGYLTSEPYEVERQTGWKPLAFLLADSGYTPYVMTITARVPFVESNPDLVQRFVNASIEGWYNYLNGDNRAANEMIKKDNPEITDGQLAYSVAKLKEYGIVDSGDALDKGIGCMTDERYKKFFTSMAAIKVFKPDTNYQKAFTTKFVCKGVGISLKKQIPPAAQ